MSRPVASRKIIPCPVGPLKSRYYFELALEPSVFYWGCCVALHLVSSQKVYVYCRQRFLFDEAICFLNERSGKSRGTWAVFYGS